MTIQSTQAQLMLPQHALPLSQRSEKVAQVISIMQGKISKSEAERSIRYVEGMMKVVKKGMSDFPEPTTRAQKQAAAALGVALRRLLIALNDPHQDRLLRSLFDRDFLKKCVGRCDLRAATKLPKPKRNDGGPKLVAAHEAGRLLGRAGLPLNITPNGRFCRLTAILAGAEI